MTVENEVTLKNIKDMMENMLEENSGHSLAVGWKSREDQLLRFDQFQKMLELAEDEFSLNDFGCGLADFYNWMKEKKFPIKNYYGYDLSEKMLEAAKQNVDGFGVEFFNKRKIQTSADFSIACGIFNTRLEESDTKWTEYLKDVISDLANNSKIAFAFNSLSIFVDYREPHLFYADPCYWFEWCKKNLSKKVALLHDSELFEFTIIVKK